MSNNGGKMRMLNRRRSNLSIHPCGNQDFTAPGLLSSYSAPDPGLRMAIRSYIYLLAPCHRYPGHRGAGFGNAKLRRRGRAKTRTGAYAGQWACFGQCK